MANVVSGTPEQRAAYVNTQMKRVGRVRVVKAHVVAREDGYDEITGALGCALSFRETGGRNILGDKEWAQEPEGPVELWHARGAFQIYDEFHMKFLRSVVGCPGSKTIPDFTRLNWIPIPGTNAGMPLMVPTWEDGWRYAISILVDYMDQAKRARVPYNQRLAVALAAYNAGWKAAFRGWLEGDIDKYTTPGPGVTVGNYSYDVLLRAGEVQTWLHAHPNWMG